MGDTVFLPPLSLLPDGAGAAANHFPHHSALGCLPTVSVSPHVRKIPRSGRPCGKGEGRKRKDLLKRCKKPHIEVAQMYFLSVLLFQVMLERSICIC